MQIKSPITGEFAVEVVRSLNSQAVIESYKHDFGIDLNRFFLGVDEVLICECSKSGLLFYYPSSLSGDEKFYDDLKKQMPLRYNLPYYPQEKWEYRVCLEMVKNDQKVYEIGAGDGAFLEKLARRGVADIFGSELNGDSIKSAAKRNIKLEFKTIEEKSAEINDEYDIVFAFQVLEHVIDVKAFLEASIKIVKPGGKLIIAVPYNNPYLFKNDVMNTLNLPPHHMGLWGKKAFKNLSRYFPVDLVDIIIEPLATQGYDFDRYYQVNKDKIYPSHYPLKKIVDKIYFKWLKANAKTRHGKNILAVFTKR